jgi:tRNA G37 N-methylase Trm5
MNTHLSENSLSETEAHKVDTWCRFSLDSSKKKKEAAPAVVISSKNRNETLKSAGTINTGELFFNVFAESDFPPNFQGICREIYMENVFCTGKTE